MPSRLKSLELHGYKTFAAHTDFVFSGLITAIVGPNGSGKSNVADAIRWVLGEQSFSLLRAKKTEDMIFSGSEQRPRAGMASATIVFDNEDGWLPIDFSEVAVTRRAYRDGENEYLLNNQRVRLRDMSELFARSGLAERTYTIIGQGLVDAALALRAEERRRLFEEAAGIGLYRLRKEEGLRRLEATRHNLERVEDILAELQPRLRSLERQARRAQEYEQIKADLRMILREWYGYHWHKAQKELTEAHEIAHQMEMILENKRQDQIYLEDQLLHHRQRIQEVRTRINTWHRQSAEFQAQSETISRDLAIKGERLRSLDEQRQQTETELALLVEEIKLHQEWVNEAEEGKVRLQAELEEALNQAKIAGEALLTRQLEREGVEKVVHTARQSLAEYTARQEHLKIRLYEKYVQAEKQAQDIQKSLQAVVGAAHLEQEQKKRLIQASKELEIAQSARQELEKAQEKQGRLLVELEIDHKQVQASVASCQAEIAGLRAQLDVLEKAEQALTGYVEGARLLIQAARQARLPGTRGALSSFLEIQANYETAIAAALGEFTDAVLLETNEAEEKALQLLEGGTSKAVLLPLSSLQSEYHIPDTLGKNQPGVVGRAIDLVKAPEELMPVLTLLLGGVWVVRERGEARKLLAHLSDQSKKKVPGLRVVTLRGEVFYASGPILAGQEGKSVTISRPRQRREISQLISEKQKQTGLLQQNLQKAGSILTSAQAEAKKITQKLKAARQQEEKARLAYNQQEAILERASRQHQWLRQQKNALGEEVKRGLEETNQITVQMTGLEQEIRIASKALREQNQILAALSIDEQQTQLFHWNTRQAVAEQAVQEAAHRLEERLNALERVNRTLSAMQNRLMEYKTIEADLEKEKISLRESEVAKKTQIDEIQALIAPAQTELEQAENQITALEAHVVEERNALSLAEHRHAQAKINAARRNEILEGLRHRIEDDFGLVAFEYAENVSGPTPLPLEGMVEQLPMVRELNPEIEEIMKRQRLQLQRIGSINVDAGTEYEQIKERFEFLTEQVADLHKAAGDIQQVIRELDLLMEREFRKTFEAVAHEFRQIFTRLFGGGSARLVLTDPEDMTGTGIDIEARLPGRRTQGLALLSGGERSLTAAALVFGLLKVAPTPFCVLDEVDAMLDEANVSRFRDMLSELAQETQFIIITHNRNTVQAADVIYGVTMGLDSTSQVLSLKLDEISKVVE